MGGELRAVQLTPAVLPDQAEGRREEVEGAPNYADVHRLVNAARLPELVPEREARVLRSPRTPTSGSPGSRNPSGRRSRERGRSGKNLSALKLRLYTFLWKESYPAYNPELHGSPRPLAPHESRSSGKQPTTEGSPTASHQSKPPALLLTFIHNCSDYPPEGRRTECKGRAPQPRSRISTRNVW